MGLAEPGGGNADELGFGAQRLDVADAAVPHSAPEPADHLENHVGDRPAERYAAFDPLRHQLLERDLAFLEVAVGRALFHGGETPHPADDLEAPPLEQERFAGA